MRQKFDVVIIIEHTHDGVLWYADCESRFEAEDGSHAVAIATDRLRRWLPNGEVFSAYAIPFEPTEEKGGEEP